MPQESQLQHFDDRCSPLVKYTKNKNSKKRSGITLKIIVDCTFIGLILVQEYSLFPVSHTQEDHQTWCELILQQLPLVNKFACSEYLHGLEILNFPKDKIPHYSQISEKLSHLTKWRLIPVSTLVAPKDFFHMLSNKYFPIITTMRPRNELNFYTNESPDIFHELFGHCPLITNQQYAYSLWKFGTLASQCNTEIQRRLSKIFWATFEFGLLINNEEYKAYGAGILPSKSEILNATQCQEVERRTLNIFGNINASLSGNITQPIFYTLNSLEGLYHIVNYELEKLIIYLRKSQSSEAK